VKLPLGLAGGVGGGFGQGELFGFGLLPTRIWS
jgi:hypothetical protein